MNKLRIKLCFIALMGLLTSLSWATDTAGGKGTLKSDVSNRCIDTRSYPVTQVCGNFQVNWKMWGLMGEPVGDYNLAWKLSHIQLMNKERNLVSTFTPEELPAELRKGAAAIEFYIDGFSSVSASDGKASNTYLLRFNTGTAVRANKGSSFNTPGSPNWNKLFITGGNPCLDKQATFLDEGAAKALFKRGIQLTSLTLCPSSTMYELTQLESSIAQLCEKKGADKTYTFCPKQETKKAVPVTKKDNKIEKEPKPNTSSQNDNLLDGPSSTNASNQTMADLLDENAERPLIKKRLAQQTTIYRTKAEAECRSVMRDVDACYAKTNCQRIAETPSELECKDVRPYISSRAPPILGRCDAECVRENERKHNELDRAWQSQWERKYGALYRECQRLEPLRKAFGACQKQYASSCNPSGFTSQAACVESKMRSGPTEQDARSTLKKEWEGKSTPSKKAPSEKNTTTTNFLD